jgi:chemotaxis protein histidine kinase CheA
MNRVTAHFVEEATECLDALEAELGGPEPDPGVVYRTVRQLRGSAQVARFGALVEEARPLEETLKTVARGERSWGEALAARVREDMQSLARGVDAVREGRMEQDDREPPMEEQGRNESGEVVPIETLEYSGPEALARARTLREPLEDAIVAGDPPGAILDELFDLIRLGTK